MPASIRLSVTLALGLAAVLPGPASAQVVYTVTDLGTFGGTISSGTAINASGQVTGYAYLPGNTVWHAFRYTPGRGLTDLGTIGSDPNSVGTGINDSGQVVGRSIFGGGSGNRGFRTTANGLASDPGTDLGSLGGNTGASAINSAGQVTGSVILNSSTVAYHAYRTSPTGLVSDAGADLGFTGIGVAINDSGQVAGLNPGTGAHAFRTNAAGQPTDLGTLGGSTSRAYGMNTAGRTVGWSFFAGDTVGHAFRTTATGLVSDPGTDLGALPGFPGSGGLGINSSGVVVGFSGPDVYANDSINSHAFIYDTQMRDLNQMIPANSGWVLNAANAINDSGWITGFGTINGQPHAFVLTPVPEPSGLLLAGAALAGGWLFRRRRALERQPDESERPTSG